jgi:hypothetical protein
MRCAYQPVALRAVLPSYVDHRFRIFDTDCSARSGLVYARHEPGAHLSAENCQTLFIEEQIAATIGANATPHSTIRRPDYLPNVA